MLGASLLAAASAEQQVLRPDLGWGGVPAAISGCCAASTNDAGGCGAVGLTKVLGLGSRVACCAGKPTSVSCSSINDLWSGNVVYAGTTYQCATLATGQPKCLEPSATSVAATGPAGGLATAETPPQAAVPQPAVATPALVFVAPAGGCTIPSGTACPTNAAFRSASSMSSGGIKYCCYGGSVTTTCGSFFAGEDSGSYSCGGRSAACSDVPACSSSSSKSGDTRATTPSGAAWLTPSVLAALGVVVAALA